MIRAMFISSVVWILSLPATAAVSGECLTLATRLYDLPPSLLLALSSVSGQRITIPASWAERFAHDGTDIDKSTCANLVSAALVLRAELSERATVYDSLTVFSSDSSQADAFALRVVILMRRLDAFARRNQIGGLLPSGGEFAGLGAASPPGVASHAWHSSIVSAAAAAGLTPAFLHAVVRAESGYNPGAISPKGAAGLMQLMPETAKRYGVNDRFNPGENLMGGARYLKDLLILFNFNVELAIAAYNAGEGAVIKYGNKVPPFPETKAYVPKVLAYMKAEQAYGR